MVPHRFFELCAREVGHVCGFRLEPFVDPLEAGEVLVNSACFVAQQPVHVTVRLVEVAAATERGVVGEPVDRLRDERVAIAAGSQIRGEQLGFDVRSAGPVFLMAEVVVAKLMTEQLYDAVVRPAFSLANIRHGSASILDRARG